MTEIEEHKAASDRLKGILRSALEEVDTEDLFKIARHSYDIILPKSTERDELITTIVDKYFEDMQRFVDKMKERDAKK